MPPTAAAVVPAREGVRGARHAWSLFLLGVAINVAIVVALGVL